MSRDDVFGSWSSRIVVGLSAPVGVTAISGQNAVSIKLLTGGTLEIGGSASLTGQTWGSMYPVSSNEVVSFNMSGMFWLWASGATCTVAILRGRSQGSANDAP